MSQHDYSIANGSGAAVRGDINTALGAILTSNSGPSAPTVTAPFMLWLDTVNSVLKIRNAADSGWLTLFDATAGLSRQDDATASNSVPRLSQLVGADGLYRSTDATTGNGVPRLSQLVGADGLYRTNDATTGNGVPRLSQVWSLLSALLPAGAVVPFAMYYVPPGFLMANGAEVSRTTFASLFSAIGTIYGVGNGSTTFNLPDLRGEFIRGYDAGRGVDPGRWVGNFQGDQLGSHAHTYDRPSIVGGTQGVGGNLSLPQVNGGSWTGSTGGNETRPRNIAVFYCIKY